MHQQVNEDLKDKTAADHGWVEAVCVVLALVLRVEVDEGVGSATIAFGGTALKKKEGGVKGGDGRHGRLVRFG